MIYGATRITAGNTRVYQHRVVFGLDAGSRLLRFHRAVSAVNAIQAFARAVANRTLTGHRKRWRRVSPPAYVRGHSRDAWARRLLDLRAMGR